MVSTVAVRILIVALPLVLGSARAADGANDALGQAGYLTLHPLPPCIAEHFANAHQRCLPSSLPAEATADAQASVHMDRAITYAYLRRWQDARGELEAAFALRPDGAEARHLAARVALTAYDEQRDASWLATAREQIAAALALAPRSADIAATQAFLVYLEGQHEDAVAAYGSVIAMQPDHAFALGQRAMLHAGKGRFALALEDYDKAIVAAPRDALLRHGRAGVALALGKPDLALADLNAILEANPLDFLGYGLRAGAHRQLGNLEGALEDLSTLIDGPKGRMPFATAGDQLAGFFMQRAMVLSDLQRNADAARDMLHALQLGGKAKILRLQVYLRRNGYGDLALDGMPSGELAAAVEACFAKKLCRAGLVEQA